MTNVMSRTGMVHATDAQDHPLCGQRIIQMRWPTDLPVTCPRCITKAGNTMTYEEDRIVDEPRWDGTCPLCGKPAVFTNEDGTVTYGRCPNCA